MRYCLLHGLASIVLAALMPPAPAGAAESQDEALIRQGVAARRRNDDASALELFRQAYAINKSPKAAAQIALAEIALGRWLDAEVHLEEALTASSDPWIRKNQSTLKESLARVRQELGTLEVLGGPPGAEVLIGGEVKGTLPLAKPIRVRAGDVRFELRAHGYASEARTVRIAGEQLTRETLTLVPVRAETPPAAPEVRPTSPPKPSGPDIVNPPPQPPSPAPESGSRLRTAGVILGGAGVAAIAAGVLFGLKVRSANNEDAARPVFDPDAYDSGQRYETFQWIGYGGGAALLLGGATAYWLGQSHQGDGASATVSFVPTSGGLVGSVNGRF